jgi:hypothetical protein
MQGHLKININLFSALCPPQLHKKNTVAGASDRFDSLEELVITCTIRSVKLFN